MTQTKNLKGPTDEELILHLNKDSYANFEPQENLNFEKVALKVFLVLLFAFTPDLESFWTIVSRINK